MEPDVEANAVAGAEVLNAQKLRAERLFRADEAQGNVNPIMVLVSFSSNIPYSIHFTKSA